MKPLSLTPKYLKEITNFGTSIRSVRCGILSPSCTLHMGDLKHQHRRTGEISNRDI